MINIFLNIKLFLSWLFVQHQKLIYTDLDPIKNWSFYFGKQTSFCYKNVTSIKNNQQPSFNLIYLMPCLVLAYTLPDSLYIFVTEVNSTLPNLYTHYFFLSDFWPQTDIFLGVSIVMGIFNFGNLFFNPQSSKMLNIYFEKSVKKDQIKMLISNNQLNLVDFVLAKKLLCFRFKIKKLFKISIIITFQFNTALTRHLVTYIFTFPNKKCFFAKIIL